MENFIKYQKRINVALKNLESNYKLIVEAKEMIEIKKKLEDKVVSMEKQKVSSIELIDQALEEMAKLRNKNVTKPILDG